MSSPYGRLARGTSVTRVAASILAQMVKRLQKAKARVGHIKYAGLQIGTIRKYNMAINYATTFFTHMSVCSIFFKNV